MISRAVEIAFAVAARDARPLNTNIPGSACSSSFTDAEDKSTTADSQRSRAILARTCAARESRSARANPRNAMRTSLVLAGD